MGAELTHAEIAELLGAYALDAVEGEERQLVERHLGECGQCRREVAEHREVAGLLASGWLPAPEGLWDRIAANLEEKPPPLRMPGPVGAPENTPLPPRFRPAGGEPVGTAAAGTGGKPDGPAPGWAPPQPPQPPQPPPSPVIRLEEARRRRPLRGFGRAVAAAGIAASVAVVALVGVIALDGGDGADDLSEVAAAAAERPDARTVAMRSADGRLAAEAVVLPDGTGYLVETNLPELPPDRTYQLWAVVGSNKISVGVLGRRVGPLAFRASADVSAFAITNETAGGVVVSQQEPTVVGSPA